MRLATGRTGESLLIVSHGGAIRSVLNEVEPINLIESAGPALAKRLAPIVGLVVLLILIARRRRH